MAETGRVSQTTLEVLERGTRSRLSQVTLEVVQRAVLMRVAALGVEVLQRGDPPPESAPLLQLHVMT